MIKGLSGVALLMIVLCVCDGGEKVSLVDGEIEMSWSWKHLG